MTLKPSDPRAFAADVFLALLVGALGVAVLVKIFGG